MRLDSGMDHNNYEIDQLISAKSIAARVEALAREITSFFSNTDKLVVVGLLRGFLHYSNRLPRLQR